MVIFGEARGEPLRTKIAIGDAIINRALHPGWWGRDLKSVILKPWQFSSFNGPETIPKLKPGQVDPNYAKLREPLKYESEWVWEACCVVAQMVYQRLSGQGQDTTEGANHYYDTSISAPKWADESKFTVALPAARKGHEVRFYRLT